MKKPVQKVQKQIKVTKTAKVPAVRPTTILDVIEIVVRRAGPLLDEIEWTLRGERRKIEANLLLAQLKSWESAGNERVAKPAKALRAALLQIRYGK